MRRRLRILLVSAASLALALVAAELAVSGTREANVIAFVPDDEQLIVREPSKNGWSWMLGRWVSVRTNAYSLRDDEVPATKAPGELRVLCLGDSFTYGGGCEQEHAWPQQAQALVGPADASGLRFLNAGANGWDTRFQLVCARRVDAGLQPDVVVLAWNWNDVKHSDFDAESARMHLSGGFGTLLGLDVSGTWLVRSKLYRFLHQRYNGSRHVPTREQTERRYETYVADMHARVLAPELAARARADWPGEGADVPMDWWIATDSPAFADVRAQMQALADHGRERGVGVLVAMMPEPTWSGPGPYPPRARLAAMLDGLGVPWVDLMDAFLAFDAEGGTRRDPALWLELDYVHPSPEGQRRIAEGVVRCLRERELLRPRRGG